MSFLMNRVGSTGLTISSMTASRMVAYWASGACCVLTTTVSMHEGRPASYCTVTWLLPSGRRNPSLPSLRTDASRRVMPWASMMGRGMSSSVSVQANPNMMPWSPAPCSVYRPCPSVTPTEMSSLCFSMTVSTAQVRQSNPMPDES